MKVCPKCKSESDFNFCNSCGTPMVEKLPSDSGATWLNEAMKHSDPTMLLHPKVCPKCNFESHNANYCSTCGSQMVDKQSPLPPPPVNLDTFWPGWKIVGQDPIGEGSYGKVYKASKEDRGAPKNVSAVKIVSIPKSDAEANSLRPERTDARTFFEGIKNDFINEIQFMVSMKGHSNIVSIEEYAVIEKSDKIGWDIYIRMELLTSLDDYASDNAMYEEDVIKLGKDVCTALELCEKYSIIHRDIKPANIFRSPHGNYKVGDFGIARELEKSGGTQTAIGSPDYVAPEVITGKYDATVDTYSLGLVLYKLLNNNRLPFIDPYAQPIHPADRQAAKNRRLRGEPLPAPINASTQMAQLIQRACVPNPAHRFKSAADMKSALEGTYKHPIPLLVTILVATIGVSAAMLFMGVGTLMEWFFVV